MTKQWILYVLVSAGLVALALWLYRRNAAPPVERETIVTVSTDDPNMIIPDFNNDKVQWKEDYINGLPLNHSLTTTYVQK